MTKKITQRHVSGKNKVDSRENTLAKISVLQKFAATRPSVPASVTLPRTLRQFNFWAPKRGSVLPGVPDRNLKTTGPQTLRADEELTGLACEAMSAANAPGADEARASRRQERLVNYKARLNLSESLRKICEAKLSEALHQLELGRQEKRALSAQLASVTSKLRQEVDELEMALNEERTKVADLTATLRKTTRLSRAK